MNILSNIRFTGRLFFKNLSNSLMAVVVLAFGIAISVCMFSMANGFLWSSPSIVQDNSLVHLNWVNEGGKPQEIIRINVSDYFAIKKQNKSLTELAGFGFRSYQFSHPDIKGAKPYPAVHVTDNFFQLIGESPLLGKLPSKEEASSATGKTVVLGYELWQSEFNGNVDILGQSVKLGTQAHRVIAIMPEGFAFPYNQQLWVALDMKYALKQSRSKMETLEVIGVLSPEISAEQAQLDLNNIASSLQKQFPESNKNYSRVAIKPYNERYTGGSSTVLLIFLGFSILVLIIACINVSNLVMARVAKRQHELAVRKSLGATNRSLFYQVVLDALLISVLGALFGLLLAHWGTRYIWELLLANYGNGLPYWWHINITYQVIIFATVVTFLCAIISSLVPALKVVSNKSIEILKDSTRTSSGLGFGRMAKIMVGVQILVSTVLLCSAIVNVSVIAKTSDRQLTFNPDKILTARIQAANYAGLKSMASVNKFYQAFTHRIKAIPGVDKVAFAFNVPGVFNEIKEFEIEGRVAETEVNKMKTAVPIVTTEFFDLVKVKLLQGRIFNSTDVNGSQAVTVVNQHFVDSHFPNQDPIGKRIRVLKPGNFWEVQNAKRKSDYSQWMTIVGVVGNYQGKGMAIEQGQAVITEVYMPVQQWPSRGQWLLVEGQGDVNKYAADISDILLDLAPMIPTEFKSVTAMLDRNYVFAKLMNKLMIVFSATALLMTATGLYGLVSFTTQLKIREFGIRMALGASPKKVLLLILGQSKWQIGLGVFLGGVAAYSVIQTLEAMTGNPEGDMNIMHYIAIALPVGMSLVLLASIMATAVPAWQATKVPPNVSLRSE